VRHLSDSRPAAGGTAEPHRIEQAKGVLAERQRASMDEAFALLRGYARSHNLRLAPSPPRSSTARCQRSNC